MDTIHLQPHQFTKQRSEPSAAGKSLQADGSPDTKHDRAPVDATVPTTAVSSPSTAAQSEAVATDDQHRVPVQQVLHAKEPASTPGWAPVAPVATPMHAHQDGDVTTTDDDGIFSPSGLWGNSSTTTMHAGVDAIGNRERVQMVHDVHARAKQEQQQLYFCKNPSGFSSGLDTILQPTSSASTFQNASVFGASGLEESFMPRLIAPIRPPAKCDTSQVLDYIKQQLDCFGKEPLLLGRYQLLGPKHRCTGGVLRVEFLKSDIPLYCEYSVFWERFS